MLQSPVKSILETTQYFCVRSMAPHMIVRPASLADLAKLTDVYNYYVEYSPATFDIQPFTPQQREGWFHDHSDGHRHRLLVAEQKPGEILGYAASGPFRSK